MIYFNSKIKAILLFASVTSVTGVMFQNCSNKSMLAQNSFNENSQSTKFFTSLFSKENTTATSESSKSSLTFSTSNFKSSSSKIVPSEPLNLGFHMGGISASGQPLVEEYVFPQKQESPWYVAQWKKIKPLRPSQSLQMTDVNRSLYILKNPGSNESLLSTTVDTNGNYIYNLEAQQGYLTSVGGSNIFIAADVQRKDMSSLNREIIFSFDTKLVEKSATVRPEYIANEKTLLQHDVSGFFLGGFPLQYNDGNPAHNANIFIQFYIADTRVKNDSDAFVYRGFYEHGGYLEIVSTVPISAITGKSSDLKLAADSAHSGLTNYKISLNRLLCQSLKEKFVRNDNSSGEVIDFSKEHNGANYMKNLKYWKIGSVYMGFETQAAFFNEQTQSSEYFYPSNHPLYGAHDVRQEIKDKMINNNELFRGDVKLKAQIANLEMKAVEEPFKSMDTCDDVFLQDTVSDPTREIIQPQPTVICNTGFTQQGGACIKAQQPTFGPFVVGPTSPQQAVNASSASPIVAPVCSKGEFINAATQTVDWKCNCANDNSGWVSVGGTCYQKVRVSAQPVIVGPVVAAPVVISSCSTGEFVNSSAETVDWKCNCANDNSGWVSVGGTCYQKVRTNLQPTASAPQCTTGNFINSAAQTVDWKCDCKSDNSGWTQVSVNCLQKIR